MIEALIDGERRGPVLAELAKGKMRAKIADLSMALEGRFGDHHALMCRLHLDHTGQLEAMIGRLDAQLEAMMALFRAARDLLATTPGIGQLAAAGVICEIGDRRQGILPRCRAPGLLDRAMPGQPRIRRQAPLRQAPPRQGAPAVPPGRMRLVSGPPRRLPQILYLRHVMKWGGYRSQIAKKKAIIVVAHALIVIISLGHLGGGAGQGGGNLNLLRRVRA
jgi:transposase